MMHRCGRRTAWVVAALLFLVSLAIFLRIGFRASTDIDLQAAYLADCIENRFFPAAFLYYLVVALITAFSTEVSVILVGSALLLAAAVAARFLVSLRVATDWIGPQAAENPLAPCLLLAAAAALVWIFSFPLPGEYWYASGFPPAIWHNGTSIALLPFAVLLFHYSSRFLESPKAAYLLPIAILVALNLLIKPSLFLCFAPVFPLYALLRHGAGRAFLLACVPALLGCAIMGAQYLVIYHSAEYNRIAEAGGATLALGWFHPWKLWASNIPLVIVNATLLPLLFLAGYPRLVRSDIRVGYALALLAMAVLIYAFVHETGDRELHGNFGWQTTICNYLLHLSVTVAFLKIKLRERRLRKYDYLLIALFCLQTVFGMAYVARLVIQGLYL